VKEGEAGHPGTRAPASSARQSAADHPRGHAASWPEGADPRDFEAEDLEPAKAKARGADLDADERF
jgi:hypothetical protein